MKIETPYDIGDELYVIRTTHITGGSYIYIEKDNVKEIGKDDKGEYVNIGGVRSKLTQYKVKFFLDYKEAKTTLDKILSNYEYREGIPDTRWYPKVVGNKYFIEKRSIKWKE